MRATRTISNSHTVGSCPFTFATPTPLALEVVEKVQAKVEDERGDRGDRSQTRSVIWQVLQRFKLIAQILVEWFSVVLQAVKVGFRKQSTADRGRDELVVGEHTPAIDSHTPFN